MKQQENSLRDMEENDATNVWRVVIGWVFFVLVAVGVILLAVNFKSSEEKNSYILTYDKERYNVVPSDLIEEDKEYKEILQQYKLPIKISKENIGSCVSKNENRWLYEIKKGGTKDILILKDYNGDLVYVFSEKLVN